MLPRVFASVLAAIALIALVGCATRMGTAGPAQTDIAVTLTPDELDGPPTDPGIGETLLIVVGAAHARQAEADAAAASFGDMQGFYVDVTDNYRLLDICADPPVGPGLVDGQLVAGQWLELSAFRTWDGAMGWMEMVESSEGYGFGDAYAAAAVYLVEKIGGPYVGLGQESHPDGSGPLVEPLDVPPTCD